MMTIILSFIGFIYVMLFQQTNVYLQLGAWVGFIIIGLFIDGVILMVYNELKKNKKRRK